MIRAVWFDVGETLVDETPAWEAVADALGVPRFTLMGVLGGLAERREPHGRVFELLGVDWPLPGVGEPPPGRLYPDAAGCLAELRAAGYVTGICGNQPKRTERWLAEAGVTADHVASSASLGVAKPDPAFFAALADRVGLPPGEIAYVGDRVDLDVCSAGRGGRDGSGAGAAGAVGDPARSARRRGRCGGGDRLAGRVGGGAGRSQFPALRRAIHSASSGSTSR